MDTSSVQDLIRIDVADPCDQMLIEEHCLHRPPRSSNDSPYIVERKVVHDGIDPETVEFGQDRWTSIRIECDDLAECSRVDESQFRRGLGSRPDRLQWTQCQHDMTVGWPRNLRAGDQDLPAHPQMDHQLIAGIQCEKKILAPPARIDGLVTGQSFRELFSRCAPDGSLATDFDPFDSATDECNLETASHGLDFG